MELSRREFLELAAIGTAQALGLGCVTNNKPHTPHTPQTTPKTAVKKDWEKAEK